MLKLDYLGYLQYPKIITIENYVQFKTSRTEQCTTVTSIIHCYFIYRYIMRLCNY